MNCLTSLLPLRILPTSKNEVAVSFNIGLANFEYSSEPTKRLYQASSQSVAVIYENSALGVAAANAQLLEHLLKLIEPEDIHEELAELLITPFLRNRTEPFQNVDDYKQYFEQLGYGTGSCGFIGEVFGHSLTDNVEFSTTTAAPRDYMDEFTRACSYCAVGIDSLEGRNKQLQPLMISAMREPDEFPGFLQPVHLIDCFELAQPLINPKWLCEHIELANGEVIPAFNIIKLITYSNE